MTTPAYQPPAAAPADYPGKTLGIVGLVLVFFTGIIGLILSHVAFSQSKKAGFQNTPAKVGIILGWIFVGLGIIITIILIAGGAALFGGLLSECANLGPGEHTLSNGVQLTCG